MGDPASNNRINGAEGARTVGLLGGGGGGGGERKGEGGRERGEKREPTGEGGGSGGGRRRRCGLGVPAGGRWLKEFVLFKKFMTSRGFIHKSRVVKLVGLVGHSKRCCTEAGELLQSGQVSELTEPRRN